MPNASHSPGECMCAACNPGKQCARCEAWLVDGRCPKGCKTPKPSSREKREVFWREWIARLNVDLGARLAETIDVTPSNDENIRAAVEAAIALEQETSP